MKYQFFRIPVADSAQAEAELNAFCAQHKVASIDKQFVAAGADSCWAFCIAYLEKAALSDIGKPKPAKIDYREVLDEADFAIYARLRDLRKTLADQEGTPPYNIFTNEQLAAMVQQRIRSKSGILSLPGVGQGRVDKYADAFLACLLLPPANCAPDSDRP
ncbi:MULTISPECIES: HRDC domain-containing protein [Methylomonas]|uniref:HRDC domain-containing protein n=1 Tax=Methylomonas koyamae TaxID=702114 RepID=A0A177N7S1_9GAMM|nr:HRDC domain-containing protein [Methylomonas koyamae]OAI14086.1 hypothetical protein A1355_12750 [Methylomonas koyamae]